MLTVTPVSTLSAGELPDDSKVVVDSPGGAGLTFEVQPDEAAAAARAAENEVRGWGCWADKGMGWQRLAMAREWAAAAVGWTVPNACDLCEPIARGTQLCALCKKNRVLSFLHSSAVRNGSLSPCLTVA